MKTKKILTALVLTMALILCSVPVSAEHYWNNSMMFRAAYGTVTVDGKIDPGEWDDTMAIDIKLNNDPLYASENINYQGEWAEDRSDSDFSGTYKIKWDDKYIYFLEDRNDDYVNLFGDGEQPYMTDGTLIFTQIDNYDGSLNPDGISIHAFYTVGKDGKIGGDLKARVCNMEEGSRETVDIPGGLVASTLKTGGFIIEVAIPWAFYTSYVPDFKAPAAGDKLGLSYVVHDNDTDDPAFIKQLCYAIDNENLGDVPGGYDFGGWGVVELISKNNITHKASLSASSEYAERYGAVKCVHEGEAVHETGYEWASASELNPWIKFDYASPVWINKIIISDRANATDYSKIATLTFSDGSSIVTPELDDGGEPYTIEFEAKNITWVKFDVTEEGDGSLNNGFGRISIYEADAPAAPEAPAEQEQPPQAADTPEAAPAEQPATEAPTPPAAAQTGDGMLAFIALALVALAALKFKNKEKACRK
ncbi:MAG: hypothetical protein FWD23_00305 [Oscillospiraceae bacterium]|nr:hypothetical protein [Oscillospiraceae bacterium]